MPRVLIAIRVAHIAGLLVMPVQAVNVRNRRGYGCGIHFAV
jgi:hypothetical protein